ncbi:hypothetical protein AGIG_G14428 [Arapaima gigas]
MLAVKKGDVFRTTESCEQITFLELIQPLSCSWNPCILAWNHSSPSHFVLNRYHRGLYSGTCRWLTAMLF